MATRLPDYSDGRVLIAGGENAGGGYLSEAEIFDPATGTFSTVGTMAIGRSEHAAVKLSDGKVLITGGLTGIGTTNTTEIFDPTTGNFGSGPTLGVARAGHSATLFADGRVLIAGGDSNGSAEIFDPASGSFSAVGAGLNTARSKHSAALLLDGRVLIVGGQDGAGNALSSVEIFDVLEPSSVAAGELTVARVLPHLRVLFDGKVQIIGGNADESMEIYDPQFPGVGAYAHVLPETDTCTNLRPGILTSQTRAALFHNGQSDTLLDRNGHTISELPGSNQALVAGGLNSSGTVLDSISILSSTSASISTDKMDYAPGETATISGRGFQPGEIVRLKIHEDPHTPQERGFDATADADGNFSGAYLVQEYDLDMKFIVSARGLTSGWTAHTTFTDANNDAHVAPGWAPTNTVTTFSTLYRKTTGGTVQHVRITLPVTYTNISVAATAFSSGTWSTPIVNQLTRTVDIQLTAGTGLATNNVSWARIDVTATTPPANQTGNAAEWLMQTFTNTAGTAGEQNDNPPVLIGVITNPSATITFVDAGGNPISPVLQNLVPATVRVRITSQSTATTIKYTDVAVPTCFSTPSAVTTSAPGGNPYNPALVTDGFIRLSNGSIATNGTLTVTFNTTPNCTSGTYLVSSDPSTNATNPPSGTGQSVSTTGGSLIVAAGLADLSITKTDSPNPVNINAPLTYTIGVNNAGPDPASAVKVVDTLPAGTTFVSATGTNWTCNNVSGTVTCNRTGGNLPAGVGPAGDAPPITIVVTAPGTAGSITNSATVSSPNDNTPANNTATATTTVVDQADLSITKTDGVTSVTAGDGVTYTYTITVTNNGPGSATGVSFTDTWPTGFTRGALPVGCANVGAGPNFTCSLGTIANAGSVTKTISYTVPASTTASPQVNSVTVTSTTTDPNNTNDTATDSNTVNANADLSLAKTGPASAVAGASAGFDYTLTVTNNGPSAQTGGFTVTDTLPAGLTFQTAGSSSECSASGQLVTCTTTSGLSVSGTKVFTIHVTLASTAAAGSTLSNFGSVSSDGTTDPTPGNNTSNTVNTTVVRQTDLALVKADEWTDVTSFDFDPVIAGATGKYRLSVTNNGPSSSSGFSIVDTLPSGFTFTTSGSDPNCLAGGSNTVVCTRNTDLANGASAHFVIAYTANASIPDGTIKQNTATVTKSDSDTELAGDLANNTDTEDTTVIARANLSVTKDDGVTQVTAGDGVTYTYTMTVTNAGPSDAQNVSLADTWPAGFTQGTVTPSQGSCTAGPNFNCSLGVIAAGGNATVTATYTVPASTTATPQTNTAVVSSDTTDPDAANNTASDTNTVLTSANLSVTKDDGVTQVTAGDGVTYTYTMTVSNAGPSDAQNVSLSDTWPAGFSQGVVTPSQGSCTAGPNFSCSLGVIAAGANATVTATYTVPASTTATPQTNTVVVSSDTTDPEAANNTASDSNTVLTPDVRVQKSASPVGPVSAGDEIGFNVTLSNIGDGTAFGLSFTDTLPNSGLSWSISPASPGWSISGNSLIYSPTTLAAGASTTVHVKATSTPAHCGVVSNTASASASNEQGSVTGNNSATASVTVNCPDLVVIKVADATLVNAGSQIGFKITVTNSGPGQAKGVMLTDTLPTHAKLDNSDPALVWMVDAGNSDSVCTITGGNSLSCSFGDLATTVSKKVHVTATTTPANCGTVSNTATATATNERTSDTGNNSSTATIVLTDVTAPTISITAQNISTLWPPDHKYVTVGRTNFTFSVTDSCSTTLNASAVYILSVSSHEYENVKGGDGNTYKDMVIACDRKSVDLRAERDGSKNGRVYRITFAVNDSAGNVGTTEGRVTVPHSQGPKGGAVEEPPIYFVSSATCP